MIITIILFVNAFWLTEFYVWQHILLTLLLKCIIHTPWRWPSEGWNMPEWYSVNKVVVIYIYIYIYAFGLYLKYSICCYRSMALSVATVSFKTRAKKTVTASSFIIIMQNLPSKHHNQKLAWQFQLSFRNPDPASLIGISHKHNKYSHFNAYPLRLRNRSIITKMSTEYLNVIYGWCSALLPRLPMESKMKKNSQSQFPQTSSLFSSKTYEAT
jgi:hypothetical protein